LREKRGVVQLAAHRYSQPASHKLLREKPTISSLARPKKVSKELSTASRQVVVDILLIAVADGNLIGMLSDLGVGRGDQGSILLLVLHVNLPFDAVALPGNHACLVSPLYFLRHPCSWRLGGSFQRWQWSVATDSDFECGLRTVVVGLPRFAAAEERGVYLIRRVQVEADISDK
jgi:hypothetical protein